MIPIAGGKQTSAEVYGMSCTTRPGPGGGAWDLCSGWDFKGHLAPGHPRGLTGSPSTPG